MMKQKRAHDSQIVRAKENLKMSHGGPRYIQESGTNQPNKALRLDTKYIVYYQTSEIRPGLSALLDLLSEHQVRCYSQACNQRGNMILMTRPGFEVINLSTVSNSK